MSDTTEDIQKLFENFKSFLIEKNNRYGDAALKPLRIFPGSPTEELICNHLNEKLSRIQNSNELRKNDIADTFGYLALLMISKGWITFDDLLD